MSGSAVINNWANETIYTLLQKILSLFSPQVLATTQSKGLDGKKYERIYQDEFYRCCYLLAPTRCHPDIGSIYGSAGFLDFYFNGENQWGYELLRNGDRLKGHFERFDVAEGKYRLIPLQDYAIVDFNESNSNHREIEIEKEKYYNVVFSEDFKDIQLHHNNLFIDIQCRNQ